MKKLGIILSCLLIANPMYAIDNPEKELNDKLNAILKKDPHIRKKMYETNPYTKAKEQLNSNYQEALPLIHRGANPNVTYVDEKDDYGSFNILHKVVFFGDDNNTEKLIELFGLGASTYVNCFRSSKKKGEKTISAPIGYISATQAWVRSKPVLLSLNAREATVNFLNEYQEKGEKLINLLAEDKKPRSDTEWKEAVDELLKDNPHLVNYQIKKGRMTPLIATVQKGDTVIMKKLLQSSQINIYLKPLKTEKTSNHTQKTKEITNFPTVETDPDAFDIAREAVQKMMIMITIQATTQSNTLQEVV